MTQTESEVLELRAEPGALDGIAAALARTWASHPQVPESIRLEMGIAVAEIGANIIEHSASVRPVRVRADIRVLPTEVRIEFVDDGDAVEIDLTQVSLPDEMAERGRGLALAKAVLGLLDYQRTDVNVWTLVSKPFVCREGS